MTLDDGNIEITLEYDEDGFPLIYIQTNGFTSDKDRPAVQISLNNVGIHEMFDEDDERWESS